MDSPRPRVAVGFVGAGHSAGVLARSLRTVAGVDVILAAVSAGRVASAASFAEMYGVERVHEDWRELVRDPSVDVVCVCAPNAMHEEIVVEAARSGKHVICEKPISGAFGASAVAGEARAADEYARAMASVGRIERAITGAGVRFMYAENWVYAPAVAKLRSLLRAGGTPVLDIRAESSHSGTHAALARTRATAGGGALLTLGSHPIAAALHLKEYAASFSGVPAARPVAVTAECAVLHPMLGDVSGASSPLVAEWDDVETWSAVVIAFSDGSRATIHASFAMLGGARNSLEVYTTSAAHHVSMTPTDGIRSFSADPATFGSEHLHEKVESRTGWMSVAADDDWVRGYPQQMQEFMSCVVEDRAPLAGFSLARNVLGIVYAAYLSAARGERVLLGQGID